MGIGNRLKKIFGSGEKESEKSESQENIEQTKPQEKEKEIKPQENIEQTEPQEKTEEEENLKKELEDAQSRRYSLMSQIRDMDDYIMDAEIKGNRVASDIAHTRKFKLKRELESLDELILKLSDGKITPENPKPNINQTPTNKKESSKTQKIDKTPSHKDFEYLDELIHSGKKEIVLDSDIKLERYEESEYSKGIELNVDDLVIDGKGHSIDANGKARIFKCAYKNITIKNITLKNGYVYGQGGAIYNQGRLTLENAKIIDNKSNEGGAIYNVSVLNISNSEFRNNIAYDIGGAIYNLRSKVRIEDSILNENIAKHNGGVIFNKETRMNIKDSILNENKTSYGGAIANYDNSTLEISSSTLNKNINMSAIRNHSSKLIIVESTLDGNISHGDGGAIDNLHSSELEIKRSIINGNSSRSGGAISSKTGCRAVIGESTLNENSSNQKGGAIYCNGELEIFESKIDKNTSKEEGSAIYASGGKITVKNSEFIENTSNDNGSVISNLGHFNIIECEISTNKSFNTIYNNDALNVFNSIFTNNQSNNTIFNDEQSNSYISYGKFVDNDVIESVILCNGRTCTIEKSIFENNLSREGSVNILNKRRLTLIQPKIEDEGKTIFNEEYISLKKSSPDLLSKIYGYGLIESYPPPDEGKFDFGYLDKKIHQSETKEISLDQDITLENYELDFYEGGIELDIDDLVIDGNGKTIDGADKSRIFIVTGKNITLKNIVFKNAHAFKNLDNPFNNNGGTIKANHLSELTIENCKFINSTSEGHGGAIFNQADQLTIKESIFDKNTASGGGAIFNNYGRLTIDKSTLTENVANLGIEHNLVYIFVENILVYENTKNCGGAIYNMDRLTINDSILDENTADCGGAIYNYNGKQVEILNSRLMKNATDNQGGAIFISDLFSPEISITQSKLNQNTAYNEGGAIYDYWGSVNIYDLIHRSKPLSDYIFGGPNRIEEGTIKIANSELIENSAQRNGGAIYVSKGIMEITDSELMENSAQKNGGAIFCNDKEKMRLNNCALENNQPEDF